MTIEEELKHDFEEEKEKERGRKWDEIHLNVFVGNTTMMYDVDPFQWVFHLLYDL